MLEIKNVHKYFNKNKKNELHVINDTSISLGKSGLVALLGSSGSGKTTLLNSIGGLDKIKKGSIYVNNEKISSKFSSKVDKIRNLNLGYIFQDYKLIDNLSVYDNVALVLTMIGIKDKKEVKTRVEYVLDKVGMLRYKQRPAGMLSGGERQRVGIARAIVKDPNIILADEPTGNLDSKNSLEIMKIIKAISKDRLVILVTHEQNLARFYATRIIELQDGKVMKDYANEIPDELDYEIDNTFYLKDFKNINKINKENDTINIYSDNNEKINLDIIIKNNNIYLKTTDNYKMTIIDEASNIEVIDDNYKKIGKDDIDKYEFNFKEVINSDIKKKYSSILNPISLIINGFKKVFDFSVLKKILLFGFLLSGMFIMYGISSIGAILNIKDENFVTINKEYLTITSKKVNVNDYLEYEKKENINYMLPGDSTINFGVLYKDYFQTSNVSSNLVGSLSSIDMLKESDITYGKMPENEYEVVVDEFTIKKMFGNSSAAKMSGISTAKEMVGRNIYLNNMKPFLIVGITSKGSPSIYCSKNLFMNMLAGSMSQDETYSEDVNPNENKIVDYQLLKDIITLKEGRIPSNDYEVIVNIANKELMPLNKKISNKVNNTELTVVGYYYSIDSVMALITNSNTVKYNLIDTSSNMTIYSSNKDKTLSDFRELNLNINDSYNYSKDSYMREIKDNTNANLIVAAIILVISFIEIFLMIRSSFLSRIKEIGIYRAIGVKKLDIYKMFFGEIFAITTLASLPGIIFMAYILSKLSEISYVSNLFLINPLLVLIGVGCVYLFNLLVGLFPVFNTIRKTPAQILARHDLD